MIRFVEAHRKPHGVERICRILRIPPSTYYAARSRTASARALRDAELLAEIRRIHEESNHTFGARRVWTRLRAENVDVARCTVERLMREAGLTGAGGASGHRLRRAARPPAAEAAPLTAGWHRLL
ncbi:IS3 family transposase [Streptomyces kaniharaensis]|uniref:IS3 family transposase n=1 Tax=Streptomyces kaniharaensis TaxID=212423 RepID=A0A6N7KID2_9ACTN|nr:IS3 family transposase [Streptomyces kaniharaensis]